MSLFDQIGALGMPGLGAGMSAFSVPATWRSAYDQLVASLQAVQKGGAPGSWPRRTALPWLDDALNGLQMMKPPPSAVIPGRIQFPIAPGGALVGWSY
jgi:hypothetical protein